MNHIHPWNSRHQIQFLLVGQIDNPCINNIQISRKNKYTSLAPEIGSGYRCQHVRYDILNIRAYNRLQKLLALGLVSRIDIVHHDRVKHRKRSWKQTFQQCLLIRLVHRICPWKWFDCRYVGQQLIIYCRICKDIAEQLHKGCVHA